MDNTWYYTLSTIAQTLAAILGLAAVFVTIRLQNISEKINKYQRRAYHIVKSRDQHFNLDQKKYGISQRHASGLLKDLREIFKDYDNKYKENAGVSQDITYFASVFEPNLNFDNEMFLKDTIDNLSIYIGQRKKLLDLVKWPGIIASSEIIFVIILLSLSDLLYCHFWINQLFLLAIAFFVIGVILIIRSSWGLLKDIG